MKTFEDKICYPAFTDVFPNAFGGMVGNGGFPLYCVLFLVALRCSYCVKRMIALSSPVHWVVRLHSQECIKIAYICMKTLYSVVCRRT